MRLHPLLPLILTVVLLLLVFVPVPSRDLTTLPDSGGADEDLEGQGGDELAEEQTWVACDVPLEDVEGLDSLVDRFGLDEGQLELLRTQCLLAFRPPGSHHEIYPAYRGFRYAGLPILVTSDSVLHTYHVLFDSILEETETAFFAEDLLLLSRAMLEGSLSQEETAIDGVKLLARRNAAFFGVPIRLLDPEASVPSSIEALVKEELRLVEAHEGYADSPIFSAAPPPVKGYEEDYSQYVPRGHYDRSETLQRYFLAMMWYGRLGFRLVEDAETQSAILLTDLWSRLPAVTREQWWRVYNVTSFFVGEADDLLPPDYLKAVQAVYGSLTPSAQELLDAQSLERFRERIAEMRNPRIVSSLVLDVEDPVEETKGLRFMGQRYIMDSHVLQIMVYPKVEDYQGGGNPFTLVRTEFRDIRGFPRGLDVMGALGSDLAASIVEEEGDAEYAEFDTQQTEARSLFQSLTDEDWGDTLYLSWLRTLQGGLRDFDDPGLPRFMQTEAFAAEKLHTALASWAQLRHDTILYAKQSTTAVATSVPPSPPEVYVEPVVELYGGLNDLVRMTLDGLQRFAVLNKTAEERLVAMRGFLDVLLEISQKELRDEPIEPEDRLYLQYVDRAFKAILGGLSPETRDTRIVADVHTEPNTEMVLEEGTGELAVLVVAVERPDGSWFAVAGPILTYYEFKQPMGERLTDAAWRDMLAASPPRDAPWLDRFLR